jgi:hypothetical protein
MRWALQQHEPHVAVPVPDRPPKLFHLVFNNHIVDKHEYAATSLPIHTTVMQCSHLHGCLQHYYGRRDLYSDWRTVWLLLRPDYQHVPSLAGVQREQLRRNIRCLHWQCDL